ncbi:MAG: RsmB/NOP family class I SAM-dependent RNA methyltransferase [Zymomonas mobilis subsp. pomaceae]|uniref:RsmB/NOP family class I SAM-dependent RNA methyltransferase n=1 Tax=Zymomonas mobilis TaxID=542 RepID=UPI0039E90F30
MIPQARVEAAIELLDQIINAARDEGSAADRLISGYFKTRRYAGSKDRAAVRALVYRAIRHIGDCPKNGRSAMIRLAKDDPELAALFDGGKHAPAPILPQEIEYAAQKSAENPSLLPLWLAQKMDGYLDKDEQNALLGRAPLDIRFNPHITNLEAVLEAFPEGKPIEGLPYGVRLTEGTQVEKSPLWQKGAVEVQDAGSQWASLICQAKSDMRIVDLCAGVGGKTLALASDILADGGDGHGLIACDTDRSRLSRLQPRLKRAGIETVEQRLLNPKEEDQALADLFEKEDLVLIDAPCSGTGTWRRNPEARWRLNPERLSRLTAIQAYLLDMATKLVQPGGHLVYVVCSLLNEEGNDQIAAFLDRHSDWTVENIAIPVGSVQENGRRLTVLKDQTDGFFISRLKYSG